MKHALCSGGLAVCQSHPTWVRELKPSKSKMDATSGYAESHPYNKQILNLQISIKSNQQKLEKSNRHSLSCITRKTIRIRLPLMDPILILHPESQSNAPPNQVARHCFLTAATRPIRARRRAGLPKLRKRTTTYCHKASAPCFGRQHKSMSRHLPHRAGAAVPLTSPAGRPSYRAETAVAGPGLRPPPEAPPDPHPTLRSQRQT